MCSVNTNSVNEIDLTTWHRITVQQGDLTEARVDALVNAANNQLLHTAGVAGAIARKGGAVVVQESRRIGYVDTGSVAVTRGGKLPARYIIHAVGPRWQEQSPEESDRLLAAAVTAALEAARERQCLSIAFPALAAGTFGFPVDRCAAVMGATIETWCHDHPSDRPRYIRIVLFDSPTLDIFNDALRARGETR